MEAIIFLLIGWNVAQGVLFFWQLQKLVDKLMSRDFVEYHRVSQEGREKKKSLDTPFLFPGDDDNPPPNDLGF